MLARMNAALLLLLGCLASAEAAAPPPRLTPAQQKRMQLALAEVAALLLDAEDVLREEGIRRPGEAHRTPSPRH
jgi:hypothetical protein